jgi:hypothetical protein
VRSECIERAVLATLCRSRPKKEKKIKMPSKISTKPPHKKRAQRKRVAASAGELSDEAIDQLIAKVESSGPLDPVPQSASAPNETLVAANAAIETVQQAAAESETLQQFIAALEPHPNPLQLHLQKALSLRGATFTQLLAAQATEALTNTGFHEKRDFIAATEALIAFQPEGAVQSMLATQMLGVHFTALKALRQANQAATPEIQDRCMNSAVKLLRLFAQQGEVLARLKGQISQQKIIVERVNIEDGGQAIVGAVTGGRGCV